MYENLIFNIVAGKGRSGPSGDVSQSLLEQGFFGDHPPKSLKKRDPNVTGNPIDVKKKFFEQNPD